MTIRRWSRVMTLVAAVASACGPGATAPARPSTPPTTPPIDDRPHTPPPLPPTTLRLPTEVVPTGYQLSIAIDPEQPSFSGEVTIAIAIAASTSAIWLSSSGLTIDGATIAAGGATMTATIVDDAAHERIGVVAPRPLAIGPAVVTLRYRGSMVDDDAVGVFRQQVASQSYVFTQFESIYARRMVPCFDEPGWKVPWQVTVRAPAGNEIVANSPEVDRRLDGTDLVVRFAPTPPMASYLLALAVGPFATVDVGPVGRAQVPTRIFTIAGRQADAAVAAEITPAAVGALEAYFDRALPLAKLDLIAVPDFPGAMENLGLITFSESILLEDPARPSIEGRRTVRSVVAHELAHQWFGNLVTLRWWDDLWLNESFATWMAARVAHQLDPHDDPLLDARAVVERAMAADALPSARPLRRPIAGGLDVDDSFDAIAYEKGGALLAMFERRLGTDRFRAGVRGYLADHAEGSASAQDFIAALAKVSDADTSASFASFLDQPGVPEIALELDCAGRPAAVATMTSDRPTTPWVVPLCVRFPDKGGGWQERCAWIGSAGGRIELPRCPAWIVGNADGAGYYRVRYTPALDLALRTNLRQVGVADRFARVADLAAQLRAGAVELPTIAPWIVALTATDNRHDLIVAAKLAEFVDAQVDAAHRPRWQRWVRAHFGRAAAKAGLVRRPGDTAAAIAARNRVTRLVGVGGGDPGLGRAARQRVEAWLAGGADPGDDRDRLLEIAVADPPAGLRDRLAAAIMATTDRDLREALIDAIGALTSPDDRAANRALYLSGGLDAADALPLVVGGLGTRADAEAWADLVANYDAIAARLSPFERGDLVSAAGSRCTPGAHDEVEEFFTPRAAEDARLALELGPALEAIDRCVAERARLAPALATWLAAP